MADIKFNVSTLYMIKGYDSKNDRRLAGMMCRYSATNHVVPKLIKIYFYL